MRCPSKPSEGYVLPPHRRFSSAMTSPRAFKVIQQTTGQQVSQPVAQIVAGFAKVFAGEIVEKGKNTSSCPCIRTGLIDIY